MAKRQEEILFQSIVFFNEKGLNHVKLSDITTALNISLGNLTYYYKTKKDLITAILEQKTEEHTQFALDSQILLIDNNWKMIVDGYLNHYARFAFFYRDILDLDAICDVARSMYEKERRDYIEFCNKGIQIAIEKGFMIPEPRPGVYCRLAKSSLAILKAWLVKKTLLGSEEYSFNDTFQSILDLPYPYTTKIGKPIIVNIIENDYFVLSSVQNE